MCKHLGAVQRRAEREGLPFGRIAPLAKVERYMPLDPPTLDPDPDPEPSPPAGGAALPTPNEPTAYAAQRTAALADLYGEG